MTDSVDKRKKFTVIGLLLSGLPLFTLLPLGMDIFLPALFDIGVFYNSQEIANFAISIYMIAWGAGQLVWGGVSEKIGMKWTALTGLVLFSLASFMIFQSSRDEGQLFIGYRALQSLGGSACFTAIYAIIRQYFEGSDLNRAYSYLNGILAIVPVSAPLAGAYIIANQSWLYLFLVLAILGLISLIWIGLLIPADEKRPSSQPAADHSLLSAYRLVINNRKFKGYLFFALTAQACFIYYLTFAPAYLIGELGMTEIGFGKMFMLIALVFMACSFIAPKLSERFEARKIISFSTILILAGGLLMITLADLMTWFALIVPMSLIAVGCTLLLSICPGLAMEELKSHAGIASGLYTATTFGIGSTIAYLWSLVASGNNLEEVGLIYVLVFFVILFSCYLKRNRNQMKPVAE